MEGPRWNSTTIRMPSRLQPTNPFQLRFTGNRDVILRDQEVVPVYQTSYLVPSCDHGTEGKQQATSHSEHAGGQQTCCSCFTPNLLVNRQRCMELESQCANLRRGPSHHYAHHAMVLVLIQQFLHKETLRHWTGTPEDSTRLSMTFPTRTITPRTHGQTLAKSSFKHIGGQQVAGGTEFWES